MSSLIPKVSVLMSVFNGAHYLRESVESILNQSFAGFEFIIVDDGSTDNTWEILTKYAERDKRIILIKNKENLGLTKSLNKGLQISRGEYIARQDVDDVSRLNRLKLQSRFLDDHQEIGALGTNAEAINDQGLSLGHKQVPIEHESIQAYLLVNNCLYHSSLMARRSLVEALGGYNEELRYAQDYDLWWRLSQFARLANLPDKLIFVRRSVKSVTNSYRQEQLLCTLKISLKIVQESLEEQLLDEKAYQRFWWAYLRLLDKEAYQRFWWAYHGPRAQLQWGDIKRLLPFWQLLATHPGGSEIWGPRLHRLAHDLLRRQQTVEGLQLLAVVVRQLKLPIQWSPTIKGIIKPYVLVLAYQFQRALQLKQTRN